MGFAVIELITTYEWMPPEKRNVRDQTAPLADGTYLLASASDGVGETRALAIESADGGAATFVAEYLFAAVEFR